LRARMLSLFLAQEVPTIDPAITVSEFIGRFFWPEFTEKALKYSTQLHHEYFFKHHVIPAWGDRKISSLTHDDVQALIRLKQKVHLKTQDRVGYSPKTLKLLRAAISALMAVAIKRRAYFAQTRLRASFCRSRNGFSPRTP
jgi:hypothetical protein